MKSRQPNRKVQAHGYVARLMEPQRASATRRSCHAIPFDCSSWEPGSQSSPLQVMAWKVEVRKPLRLRRQVPLAKLASGVQKKTDLTRECAPVPLRLPLQVLTEALWQP
jgi:hypothetical protein